MSEQLPKCLMSERQLRRLMSKHQIRRLMFEQRTRCYLYSKVNINQLLHIILDIGKLEEQSTTWSKILA